MSRRRSVVVALIGALLLLGGCGVETVTDERFAARPDLYGGYFSFTEAGISEVRDLVGGDTVPVRFLSLLDNSEAQVQAVPDGDPGELDLWVIDDGRVTRRPVIDPNIGSTFPMSDERIGVLVRVAEDAIAQAEREEGGVLESMHVSVDSITAEVRSERRTTTLRYDGGGRLTGRD